MYSIAKRGLDKASVERLASSLAMELNAGDIVALYGDVGAGKTLFCAAAVNVLAGADDEKITVSSPTFNLVQIYDSKVKNCPIWHCDFYRIEHEGELLEIGIEEAIFDGETIIFIEWPEMASELLDGSEISIHITHSEGGADYRDIRISGKHRWIKNL